jgi:hypothetical protein
MTEPIKSLADILAKQKPIQEFARDNTKSW